MSTEGFFLCVYRSYDGFSSTLEHNFNDYYSEIPLPVEESYMKAIPETHHTLTRKIWSYPVSKHAAVPKNEQYPELADDRHGVGSVEKCNGLLQGTMPPTKLEGNKQEERVEILPTTTAVTDEQPYVDVKVKYRAIGIKMGQRGNLGKAKVRPVSPRQRKKKLRKTRLSDKKG